MTTVVAEEGLAAAIGGPPPPALVVVARPAGRRGRADLDADDVLDALDRAGPGAVVLARTPAADRGARLLPALAALVGREVVRLPDDAGAAARIVAIAVAVAPPPNAPARHLQALAGAPPLPALRPGVLARWARCAWRPCDRCGGGGLPGASCGRCGSGVAAAAP